MILLIFQRVSLNVTKKKFFYPRQRRNFARTKDNPESKCFTCFSVSASAPSKYIRGLINIAKNIISVMKMESQLPAWKTF